MGRPIRPDVFDPLRHKMSVQLDRPSVFKHALEFACVLESSNLCIFEEHSGT